MPLYYPLLLQTSPTLVFCGQSHSYDPIWEDIGSDLCVLEGPGEGYPAAEERPQVV